MYPAAKFICSPGCNSVSIQTVTNDAAILALYYAPMLSKPVYIKIGAGKNERILNLTEVASAKIFLRTLPDLHAFYEYNSTSSFQDIGQIKWLNIVTGNEDYCKALDPFGERFQIKDALFDMIESRVFQIMDFENLMSMTFYKKNVAGRNFLKFLKFHQ